MLGDTRTCSLGWRHHPTRDQPLFWAPQTLRCLPRTPATPVPCKLARSREYVGHKTINSQWVSYTPSQTTGYPTFYGKTSWGWGINKKKKQTKSLPGSLFLGEVDITLFFNICTSFYFIGFLLTETHLSQS